MHSFETKWINPYMLPDKTPEFEKDVMYQLCVTLRNLLITTIGKQTPKFIFQYIKFQILHSYSFNPKDIPEKYL